MANSEGLSPCWIRESLRNYRKSTLTKPSLVTEMCEYRVEHIVFRCKHPGARRKRVIVHDRASLTLLNKSYPYCSAVAIYSASQGQ